MTGMAEWLNIVVRFGLYVDLMLLFGLSCFGLYVVHGEERRFGQVIRFGIWLTVLSAVGLLLSAAGLVVLVANVAGSSLADPDAETTRILLNETAVGTAWKVRIAALVAGLATGALMRSPAARLWTGVSASAVALGTLAWSGHAATGEGMLGTIDLASDVAHLLAAGVWVGALLALVLLVFSPTIGTSQDQLRFAHRSLDGFSRIGTIVVALLTLTGIFNLWRRVGPNHLLSLPDTPYGQLLLAKLILFAVMLALASLNRLRLTPALARHLVDASGASPVASLRTSLALETGAAVTILALVAWFGTLEPPMPTG